MKIKECKNWNAYNYCSRRLFASLSPVLVNIKSFKRIFEMKLKEKIKKIETILDNKNSMLTFYDKNGNIFKMTLEQAKIEATKQIQRLT